MRVFRIARKKRITDLSGIGAKITGGRWNPKGFEVLYTASHSSLAILEKLVHVDVDLIPQDLYLAEIEIAESVSQQILKIKDLPKNWKIYPAPYELRKIGQEWLTANKDLLLIVPSVVNPNENNILINPNHSQINQVKIIEASPLKLDPRLFI